MDGTLGAGGHAAGLLAASEPAGQLLGLDVDPQALDLARQKLAPFGERAWLKKASYTSLPEQLATLGWDSVDGILLDLGASSMQFDTPERGFSFLADGPLDMRFDPANPLTAGQIINTWPEMGPGRHHLPLRRGTGQPAHRPGHRAQQAHRRDPPTGCNHRSRIWAATVPTTRPRRPSRLCASPSTANWRRWRRSCRWQFRL